MMSALGKAYQGEVDHMIKQFNDHTCIRMLVELNHHLATPFTGMNKTLPKSPSNIETDIDSDLLSKSANSFPTSNEGDVTAAVCYHGDTRGSGELAAQLLDTLHKAVMKRVTLISNDHTVCFKSKQEIYDISNSVAYNQPATLSSAARVAILFSGGVDSMVLAALTDRQAMRLVFHWPFIILYRCLPASESVDLINVAFQQSNKQGNW